MNRRKLTKIIAVVLAVGLPLAGAILIWRFLSSPSTGKISRGSVSEQIKSDTEAGTTALDGKLISLQRKRAYVPRPLPKPDPDSLEQHYLLTGLPYSKVMVIAVEKLPVEGLEAQSGYHLRQTLSDQYREVIKPAALHSARVMVKHDKLEQMAFIVKGSTVTTIGLTTTSAEDNLDAEMTQILTSFKWK